MLGPERQAAIANMESMGFPRADCERALRAAFFNPDRAVEYLLTVGRQSGDVMCLADKMLGNSRHTGATSTAHSSKSDLSYACSRHDRADRRVR